MPEKMIPLSWIRDMLNSHNSVDYVIRHMEARQNGVSDRDVIAYTLPEFANRLEDRYDRYHANT
jgi:hypothetical protein